MTLSGKTVLLGVSGGIAAYKSANVARLLMKQGAAVHVIMTPNATEFISPMTFEELTGHKCPVDTFNRNFEYSVEHVALAKQADVFLVAPATANVIGKIRAGVADDMLTTTIMACSCPKILAPAMNSNMYLNPIVQDNLKALADYGYVIVEPAVGMLANGDTGVGRMPDESVLVEAVIRTIGYEKDLAGKTVLITAGPTREAIDPVRFISNHSTGKMGYALARAALHRGAKVILVSGPVSLTPPDGAETVSVVSAQEMFEAVSARADEADIVIMSAAVADYRPETAADEKIKKTDGPAVLTLARTQDILKTVGASKKPGQFLCGFAMESTDLLENARKKLKEKGADMIVANSIRTPGSGFGTDTNQVILLTESGEQELPLLSKEEVAHRIFDEIVKR